MKSQSPQNKNPDGCTRQGLDSVNHYEGNQPMGILALSANVAQMMSSREIAELTGKEHKNVKRDCESMFSELNLDALSFERIYHDSMNRPQTEYMLTHELVQTLITGYSIKLRHAVIQRLNELESKNRSIPQTLPEALRLAADLAEQKAVVEQKLAIAAPKAIALDQIADTTSLFTIRQTAKMIKSKERVLVNELLRRGWVFRDKRDVLQPYAEKIEAGYVTTVMTAPVKQANGEEKVFSQLRITAKGVTRLGYVAAKGGAA